MRSMYINTTHDEYRVPQKVQALFQVLFQGHICTFQSLYTLRQQLRFWVHYTLIIPQYMIPEIENNIG